MLLTGQHPGEERRDAATDHLHPGHDQRSAHGRRGAGPHRPGRPGRGCGDDQQYTAGMDLTGAAGHDEKRDSDEPEEQTACLPPAGEAATGGGVDEGRPQRHGGQRQGRHTGRHVPLGDADRTVARE
jgi:hypothetical protein